MWTSSRKKMPYIFIISKWEMGKKGMVSPLGGIYCKAERYLQIPFSRSLTEEVWDNEWDSGEHTRASSDTRSPQCTLWEHEGVKCRGLLLYFIMKKLASDHLRRFTVTLQLRNASFHSFRDGEQRTWAVGTFPGWKRKGLQRVLRGCKRLICCH